jgi:response regulator RpfG family c-di-GMP phosphodiesterase
MGKWDDINVDFLKDDDKSSDHKLEKFKVLIADDDQEVHRVTRMILEGFMYAGKEIELVNVYSGEETLSYLKENKDVYVLFLDVVMESNKTGLEIVKKIREDLDNSMIRIILRTGQPGQAPEEDVIRDYDINDYHLKTELTARRLKTTMYTALRSYLDLKEIESHRRGLERIIEASGRLFRHDQLSHFLDSILEELSNFQVENPDMAYIREDISHGFVTMEDLNRNKIVAGTGKYKEYVGNHINEISELEEINQWVNDKLPGKDHIKKFNNGFLIESQGKSKMSNYIFIEGSKNQYDYGLIHLFLNNFSIALDNYILNNLLNTTQKEIVIALGETVESHFQETGSHIKRIAQMMYKFALFLNYSYAEAEMIKIASTMHDLGKIAIPDSILKKPGRLTSDEFEEMKTHTSYGYKILSKSNLPILRMAAEIALNHHERFDGSGYPNAIIGLDIPTPARMMAICDVFDAMTHKRVYKDAISLEETITYLNQNKGTHFDPKLIEVFMSNLKEITDSLETL